MELSTDDEEGEADSDDDDDGDTASEAGSCVEVEADSPHLLASSMHSSSNNIHSNSSNKNKEDTETLQAFLNDVYDLLSSIRKDIHEQLPAMPQILPSISSIKPRSTFDKRAAVLLESLSSNYEKAQEVLFHLSLYSPLSISLPEFPATLAASISSAAKGALAAAQNTAAQTSYPFPSMASSSASSSDDVAASVSSTDAFEKSELSTSAPTSSSPSPLHSSKQSQSFSLPQPPISAIRAFLKSESTKISQKLPKLKRPSLNDWRTSNMGSSQAVQTISNAYNEATHILNDEKEKLQHYIHDESGKLKTYIQDEKEKLQSYIHDETEKLKQALIYGKSRLLEFHELPSEWKNNKVSQTIFYSLLYTSHHFQRVSK